MTLKLLILQYNHTYYYSSSQCRACVLLSIMPSYSNAELADMHFIYGLCNGNTRASQIEYENRFPLRRIPAPAMFSRIHQALRERGTFRRLPREGIHNVDLEREILDEVNNDPETTTHALSRQFDVHHSTVWRIINRNGLYPYHFLRVQGLENADHQQRVEFCRWLLHNEVQEWRFLQRILWTDECTFTREGVFNCHNRHHYAYENPRLVRQQRF